MLVSAAPVGLALLLARMDDTPRARDFGLRRPRLGRAIALMFAVWLGLVVDEQDREIPIVPCEPLPTFLTWSQGNITVHE